jgi:hypothetical protein
MFCTLKFDHRKRCEKTYSPGFSQGVGLGDRRGKNINFFIWLDERERERERLGISLRASHMLGKYCTTEPLSHTSPALFTLFQTMSHQIVRAGLEFAILLYELPQQ